MPEPVPVSVMIFTLNEEIHLPACLKSVEWCDDVIIVDSFSTDGTSKICESKGVRFFEHVFEGFGGQRNWALENTGPRHEWTLILDADERVTEALADEMRRRLLSVPEAVAAFRLKRRFYLWGKWLRYSSLYPSWVVRLVRVGRVRYANRGHAETQEIAGSVAALQADLIDENLKGPDEWMARQERYAGQEAEFELEQEGKGLVWADAFDADPLRRRAFVKRVAARIPLRPLGYFCYSFIFRLGFLDGREGLRFCLMKAHYQR